MAHAPFAAGQRCSATSQNLITPSAPNTMSVARKCAARQMAFKLGAVHWVNGSKSFRSVYRFTPVSDRGAHNA